MKLKCIILSLMACLALACAAQPVQQQHEWEWYLGEVVNDVFVGRNYFEYYYTPSAADMAQQRDRGEVTYFLNSPEGMNAKKVRDMIDRLMASYDDIKPASTWQMTNTTYWKEFRFENNKFRFSVKRKALDDGTIYVSATETPAYYKSLGKKSKDKDKDTEAEPSQKPAKHKAHSTRRAITQQDVEQAQDDDSPIVVTDEPDTQAAAPVMSEKERRRIAREREEAQKQEERLAKRRAQEQQREEARKQKEAEKQKKAELKQQREEEKRLKKEEEKLRREQAREQREQEVREKEAQQRKQEAAESHYHYNDVALWLSDKYDFTQTAAGENTITMYSPVVKDADMAKLAIKNALKGSNARLAVPWRVNADTQAIETGYIVDGHVLVVTIGNDDQERMILTITEVSNEQFELFKQRLQP